MLEAERFQKSVTGSETAGDFYVPRRLRVPGRKPEETIADMDAPTLGRIVVVLAEPGGGKSAFAEALANANKARRFTGAEFVGFDPGSLRIGANEVVVIDGLDEIAAVQTENAAFHVGKRLGLLGYPPALIACRAADWEGARNLVLLQRAYGAPPVVAYFDPFSHKDRLALVKKFAPGMDGERFLAEAEARDLGELLGNPESLRLLVLVVKGGNWPKTRTELFSLAVAQSIEESYDFYKMASRPPPERIREAAGEIFAHLLLCGAEGVERVEDGVKRFPRLAAFGGSDLSNLQAAAGTRLFRPGGGTKLLPMHRMLAEFLAAEWLSARLKAEKISRRRLTEAVAPHGHVRSDLRGLHAWLGTMGSEDIRRAAIARDPYGVFRYGDPTGLSLEDKLHLLASLHAFAQEDPYFRRVDFGTDPMMGGFFVPELRDDVLQYLKEPNRGDHVFGLLLDCMRGSLLAAAMTGDLLRIATDRSRSGEERIDAVEALRIDSNLKWKEAVDTLRSHKTKELLRVATRIIRRQRGEGIDPDTIADTIADAQLQNADGAGMDFSIEYCDQLEALSDKLVEPVLDRLAYRMDEIRRVQRHDGHPKLEVLSPSVILLIERRFAQIDRQPTADRLWRWIRNLHLDDHDFWKAPTASAALQSNDKFRRDIQALAFRDTGFEESPWMALFRFKDIFEGIGPSESDIAYHLDIAATESVQPNNIQLWAALARWGFHRDSIRSMAERHAEAHPQLAAKWAEITRPPDRAFEERRAEEKVRRDEKATIDRRERGDLFSACREDIERGDHLGWLYDIAMAYLGQLRGINGETPEQRVADLVGRENVQVALNGLAAAFGRGDLPTIESTVRTSTEGKMHKLEYVICAGIVDRHRRNGRIDDISRSALEAGLSSNFCHDTLRKFKDAAEAIERAVLRTDLEIESFARRFFEPQIAAGLRHVRGLHHFISDERFALCAGRLAVEWLENFPNAPVPLQSELFEAALLFGDRGALIGLVQSRCRQIGEVDRNLVEGTIEPAYRAIWVPAAFLLDFGAHGQQIAAFADEGKERLWSFREIAGGNVGGYPVKRTRRWPNLDVTQCMLVIEKFAPQWPRCNFPRSGSGDTNPWNAEQFLASCMRIIESNDEPEASAALDALIGNPQLSEYHQYLRHLRAGWRKRQRDRDMRPPNFAAVQSLLKGGAPRTVPDLRAKMIDELERLQSDIRDGDTMGWRQFWNGAKPRAENDCRDHILDRLRPRFDMIDIALRREGSMPDDNRVDIVASLLLDGKKNDLPVEVKGQWHSDLWMAAVEQLEERYARYVHARGHGVYLVLWFGNVANKNLPARSDSRAKPKTSKALREMLDNDLPKDLKREDRGVRSRCVEPGDQVKSFEKGAKSGENSSKNAQRKEFKEEKPQAVTRSFDFGAPLRVAHSLRMTREGAGATASGALNPQIAVLQRHVGLERRRIAGPHHLALLDDVVAVGDAGQGLDVLVDDEDRLALGFELFERVPDLDADERRQALGGFVENEQARIGHQGAADGEHLLLAARELVAHVGAPRRDAWLNCVDAQALCSRRIVRLTGLASNPNIAR